MGDHFSSPRVFDDPAADIADVYVFPSPERPGRIVLVLTVFPSATVTSLFSDAITYRFRIRPVTVPGPGAGPALGNHEAAIGRLRPLASSSDDPGHAARLACALSAAGQPREAGQWRVTAAARYDELAVRHPEAFAGLAADFRRQAGQPQSASK